MGGYPDGRFGSEEPITREQAATILWKYAGQPEASNMQAFADQNTISSYAVPAVAWARGAGIISGKGNNRFDPAGRTTRAEMACILYNFCNKEDKKKFTKMKVQIGRIDDLTGWREALGSGNITAVFTLE